MTDQPEVVTQIEGVKQPIHQLNTPTPEKDRITVQLAMHYQQFGEEPVSGSASFSYQIEQSEDPAYQRWHRASEKWKPLETGWVRAVGYVLLENRAGKGLNTNPSPEQLEEFSKQVILVATDDPSQATKVSPLQIMPGHSMMLCPTGPLFIRCASGDVKFNVTVFPK